MPKEDTQEDQPGKKGKGMLVALLAAVLLGAGGFYVTYSGLVTLPGGGAAGDHAAQGIHAPDTAQEKEARAAHLNSEFIKLSPLVISLGNSARSSYLRFRATLEVDKDKAEMARVLIPRVLDVLNEYLRAIDPADIENPAMMSSLRAQMLRRVQLVAGRATVKDLLIVEFVLS